MVTPREGLEQSSGARCRLSTSLAVATCFTASLLLLCVGCGDQNATAVTATGTVSVGNQPLSGAVITLEPIGNTTGPNASAAIFDGKFQFPADAGLHGGRYRVRFSMIPAGIIKTIPNDGSVRLPPADASIAPAYDLHSQLEWELLPQQGNESDFQVEFLRPSR